MHEITYFITGTNPVERFYTCSECSKEAVTKLYTLETGIEHVAKNQFVVVEKRVDNSSTELGRTLNSREYIDVVQKVRPR